MTDVDCPLIVIFYSPPLLGTTTMPLVNHAFACVIFGIFVFHRVWAAKLSFTGWNANWSFSPFLSKPLFLAVDKGTVYQRHSVPKALVLGPWSHAGAMMLPFCLGQKSCRMIVPQIFRMFVPNFAPNFAPNFPRFFWGVFVLYFVGNGDPPKKNTKNPRHHSMQNSHASSKK